MRKLFLSIFTFASLASCKVKQPDGVIHHCLVTNVISKDKYTFISDGKYYTITTDCGYVITSRTSVEVGDSIDVLVVNKKNYFHK